MSKKTVAIILIVLAAGVIIYWVASGGWMFTLTKIPVEVKDELFGTTSTEWKEGFRPGLDLLGPIAGGLLVIAAVLFWLSRRSRRVAA